MRPSPTTHELGSQSAQPWSPPPWDGPMPSLISFLTRGEEGGGQPWPAASDGRRPGTALRRVSLSRPLLVTANLAYILSQLILTAGYLLPSINSTLMSNIPPVAQMGGTVGATSRLALNDTLQQNKDSSERNKAVQHKDLIKSLTHTGDEGFKPFPIKHHDVKDHKYGENGENLSLGSYEVLEPKKEEILAPHTHFCSICKKGFKRSANLRMHMRGHGDEYKTLAALAKPSNEASSESLAFKRYSCPFIGCKRNKEHEKFQPLKTDQ